VGPVFSLGIVAVGKDLVWQVQLSADGADNLVAQILFLRSDGDHKDRRVYGRPKCADESLDHFGFVPNNAGQTN
jgi:hypothetical protein